MVSDKDRKSSDRTGGGRTPKRSTTIDLTATEVARAQAAADAEKAAYGATPSTGPSSAEASPDEVPPNVFAPADPETPAHPGHPAADDARPVEPDVAEGSGLPREPGTGEAAPVATDGDAPPGRPDDAPSADLDPGTGPAVDPTATGPTDTATPGPSAGEPPLGDTVSAEPAPPEAAAPVDDPAAAPSTDASAVEPPPADTVPPATPIDTLAAASNPIGDAPARAASAPASDAPAARRASPAGLVLAACLGGVVALGGAYALVRGGAVSLGTPDTVTASVTALEARLAELDSRLGALSADDGAEARLSALEAGLAETRQAAEAAGAVDVAGPLQRLEQALAAETAAREALGASLEESTGSTATTVAGLTERTDAAASGLESLQAAVEALPKEDLAPAVRTLESRAEAFGTRLGLVDGTVADLSPSVSALKTGQDELRAAFEASQTEARDAATASNGRFDAIEQRLTALDELRSADEAQTAALDALSGKTDETVAGLGERIDGLDGSLGERIAGLDGRLGETGGALDAVDQRLAAVETVIARAPEEGEIAALSLAVTTLAGKVARGEPFTADLAAVQAGASDLPGIDGLAPFAETGVPTAAGVTASFPETEVVNSEIVAPDAEPVERLLAGARRLVNFRSTDEAEGESLGTIVGDIRAKLAAGDLVGAKASWDRLPEPAKAASAEWEQALSARIAADGAISALTDRIVERLSVQVNKN
ncbi:hypothetical protein [Methylobrevis albus]|uniref:Uncharacterized protein n=1 Tax=Methylobrevis albus TaxID=2793297 RepID=A0A931I185_9HYPH|nr:hypothetical protein [Methylobrevis albus]MBH0237912.1 hypothetical protein [Methylobrevis albus]